MENNATNRGKPRGEDLTLLLERAKAEWEAAFDSISEGIAVVEPDGRIRRTNRALAALLGREVQSLVGMYCCDVFPHHRAFPEACPIRHYPGGKKGAFEVFFPDYRYYEDAIHPILRGGKSQGYVITVRDVTREQLASQERRHVYLQMEEAARKRKLAEDSLRDARNELARVEKHAVLGNLAGMVFSEVTCSVRAIEEGLARIAEKSAKVTEGPDGQETFSIIKELERTARRNRQILEKLSRVRVSEGEAVVDVDISRVVEDAIKESSTLAADYGVTLNPDLRDLPPVKGNREQISVVISSVLLNALEASRESHGTVTISTRREGDFIRIDVHDTGQGIEAEFLPQIFNPFFTTRGAAGSAGLGLTICLAIVQSHHGHIEVRSTPDQGTNVKILLPLV